MLTGNPPARNHAAYARETRADNHVRTAAQDRVEQAVKVHRIMLTIAVEQNQRLGPGFERVAKSSLDRRCFASVLAVTCDGSASRFGNLGSSISRTVVDDKHALVL